MKGKKDLSKVLMIRRVIYSTELKTTKENISKGNKILGLMPTKDINKLIALTQQKDSI